MKKFPIAAAALLFGTSAFAMVPSTEPTGVAVDKDPYVTTGATAPEAIKPQPATVDWWGTAEPAAFTPAAYSSDDLKSAGFTDEGGMIDKSNVDKGDMALQDDAGVALEGEPAFDTTLADVEPASYQTGAVDEEPVPSGSGVGGPDAGMAMAAADMAPRPAAQNYPACSPGRGDDNCIQLYEPGVRAQLASWDQPTGGFADAGETGETQVAMGGPYEPADSATETERLNQQALAASASALQGAQMAGAAAIPTDEQMFDDSAVESASLDEGDIATDDKELVEV